METPRQIPANLGAGISQVDVYNTSVSGINDVNYNAAWINDTWKVSDRLTVKLGLRFEAYKDGWPEQEFAPNGLPQLANWPADYLPAEQYLLAIVANMEAVVAGIGDLPADAYPSPRIAEYNRLRELPPEELRKLIEAWVPDYLDGIRLAFDGTRANPELIGVKVPPVGDLEFTRRTTLLLVGTIPAGAREVTFRYAARYGGSVLRVDEADRIDAAWLLAGQESVPYAKGEGFRERTLVDVLLEYTVLGFTHILPKGLDQILFVHGLFLLSSHQADMGMLHTFMFVVNMLGAVLLLPALVQLLLRADAAGQTKRGEK